MQGRHGAAGGARRGDGRLVRPRRAELIASLSLAIDLGLGQPMEHMLRSSILGARIAARIGLDDAQRERVFYATLLAWIGCHADSHELSGLFGDDISFRAGTYDVDKHGIALMAFLLGRAGSGRPLSSAAAHAAKFALTGRRAMKALITSHCRSAGLLATRIGAVQGLDTVLAHTFERWDGAGLPAGASGPQIPIEMRIVHLADTADVFLRAGGPAAAADMARQRTGTQFDPNLAALFRSDVAELTADLEAADAWTTAMEIAPRDEPLDAAELDAVVVAMGEFADLKSPYTLGHSGAVAALAVEAGRELGLPDADLDDLRRAGHVHDLGRMGVPNTIWDKRGPLSSSEFERVRMHPYLTGRILQRIPGFGRVASIAAAHHERLDGSGYSRGVAAESLSRCDRLLAAADHYRASTEPRAHRPALASQAAAKQLRAEVRAGRLGGPEAEAVLAAAGHRRRKLQTWPAGLTNREVEVLRLVVRGASSREAAAELQVSVKTIGNHLEHIYAKLGVTNRVGAGMYAMQHGLVDRPDGQAAD